jgi:cyclic pyranopterin phosphate synthase
MVNVGAKPPVRRRAVAKGRIVLRPATARRLKDGLLKKGDALGCARLAGICAAKRTWELIPLCHNIPIDHVGVELQVAERSVEITASARCTARTGIEMEALTAVSVAALAIYDMCKAIDKQMVISDIHVVEKRKGSKA